MPPVHAQGRQVDPEMGTSDKRNWEVARKEPKSPLRCYSFAVKSLQTLAESNQLEAFVNLSTG
jgi:hypothetical protein